MLRELERTPLLSQDGVLLSKTTQRDLRRLAAALRPLSKTVEARWRRKLPAIFEQPLDSVRLRALRAINLGPSVDLLQKGRFEDFFEEVEYQSRRLAKLDVAPDQVLASVTAYQKALVPALRKLYPEQHAGFVSALEHVYFSVRLTLNDSYYQVRDVEATAFYDVLQDQLETLRVKDLLNRVLETLMRTFRASGGVIVLSEQASEQLAVKAWKGVRAPLAHRFDTTVGVGLLGEVAASGQPSFVVDTASDPRVTSDRIRAQFRSIWTMPLVVSGKVTGVVALGFAHEYHCLPREMKLFEAIAERCALAIEKAQLLEELHEREERIRALGEHMMKIEEEERRRISRELHDEVGQSLLVVRLYLEMLQNTLPKSKQQKLGEIRELVEGIIVEMRRLISALSPSVLQEIGLPASIRQFVKNLGRTFPGRVRLRMSKVDDLPEVTRIMTYRLVQECFTNAVKHSCAGNVDLHLTRRNGEIRMKMQDDGVGFNLIEAADKRDSFGLAGMRERVVLLGGDIDIHSAPGQGTKVSIAIPV